MNHNNRVLQRIGARELTRDELDQTTGAINTLTAFCSCPQPGSTSCDTDHEGCPI
jgi:hypothetical protein